MIDIKLYDPPLFIARWERQTISDKWAIGTMILLCSIFVGFISGAIATATTDGDWTSLSNNLMLLISLGAVGGFAAFTMLSPLYRLTHRADVRVADLTAKQRQVVNTYAYLSADDQALIRPIVLAVINARDDEDQRKLAGEFFDVTHALDAQRALLKKLTPNPALEDARRIREHVVEVNKELLKQIEADQ